MDMRKIRLVVDTVLIAVFVILTLSGFVLYIAPSGPGSKYWSFLGINKYKWGMLHTQIGFVFILLVLIHFWLNRKLFIGLIKMK